MSRVVGKQMMHAVTKHEQGKLTLRMEGGGATNSRASTATIGAEALIAAKSSLARVGKAIGLRRESQCEPAPTVSSRPDHMP